MSEALQKEKAEIKVSDVERVLINGDLSQLSNDQRVKYYSELCRTIGLDPLLQPFKYIYFPKSGGLKLYATKACTDQLVKNYQISIRFINTNEVNGCLVVMGEAQFPSGRVSQQVGAVSLGQLRGADLENAIMKAYTKAARRAVLQGTGLTMPDESEIGNIRDAQQVYVDEYGEVHSLAKGQKQLPEQSTATTTNQSSQEQTKPQGHESAGNVSDDLKSLHSALQLLGIPVPPKPEKTQREDGSLHYTTVQLKEYREVMRQSLYAAVQKAIYSQGTLQAILEDISVKDLCSLAEEMAFVAEEPVADADTELKAVGDDLDGKKIAPPENPFSKKKGAK